MTLSGAVIREPEGAAYGACRCRLDGHAVVMRTAKTTPTKVGQFVTLWKRPLPGGEIAPLDCGDEVDFVVVLVEGDGQRGQFIFSKQVLIEHGVLSSPAHAGKRAMRVYPPWSLPLAPQALRTQQWQLDHFLHCSADGSADPAQARRLFGAAAAR